MNTPPAAPRVTVVVATFHRAARLEPTRRSLQRQTLASFEAWICGDGCTDDTAAVVARLGDARFHWCNLSRNSGSQAAPNNEGLRRATAPLVAYLGHDDLWFPWHLEELVRRLDADAAVAAHALCAWVKPGRACDIRGGPAPAGDYRRYFVPPSSLLHRRAEALALGGWRDPDRLALPVDFDFVRRLHAAGGRISGAPRLGVMKFPSGAWKAYATESPFPQADFAARLVADPTGLERELLSQHAAASAALAAHERHAGIALRQVRAALARFWPALRFTLCDAYGFERWPLGAWLRRAQQQRRQRGRRERGL